MHTYIYTYVLFIKLYFTDIQKDIPYTYVYLYTIHKQIGIIIELI